MGTSFRELLLLIEPFVNLIRFPSSDSSSSLEQSLYSQKNKAIVCVCVFSFLIVTLSTETLYSRLLVVFPICLTGNNFGQLI